MGLKKNKQYTDSTEETNQTLTRTVIRVILEIQNDEENW